MLKDKKIYVSDHEQNLILFMRGMKWGSLEIELRDGEPYRLKTAIKEIMIDKLKPDWDKVLDRKRE